TQPAQLKMSLSDADKKALDASWKKLTAGADGKKNAGINLVLWMFANVPNMRAQFSKFNANQSDDALKGDAEFIKQVNVIVAALDGLLQSVNNPGQLQANLDKLAKSHVNLKIGLEFFGPLQQNIHSFIESALGVGAGSDEPKAWGNLIAAFNETLKKA
ncbi:Myoglobin, partial [Biomphalaria glabrata]